MRIDADYEAAGIALFRSRRYRVTALCLRCLTRHVIGHSDGDTIRLPGRTLTRSEFNRWRIRETRFKYPCHDPCQQVTGHVLKGMEDTWAS